VKKARSLDLEAPPLPPSKFKSQRESTQDSNEGEESVYPDLRIDMNPQKSVADDDDDNEDDKSVGALKRKLSKLKQNREALGTRVPPVENLSDDNVDQTGLLLKLQAISTEHAKTLAEMERMYKAREDLEDPAQADEKSESVQQVQSGKGTKGSQEAKRSTNRFVRVAQHELARESTEPRGTRQNVKAAWGPDEEKTGETSDARKSRRSASNKRGRKEQPDSPRVVSSSRSGSAKLKTRGLPTDGGDGDADGGDGDADGGDDAAEDGADRGRSRSKSTSSRKSAGMDASGSRSASSDRSGAWSAKSGDFKLFSFMERDDSVTSSMSKAKFEKYMEHVSGS
jgi:hypothetical protein